MERTQHALTSLIKVVTCAALALGAITQAQAQDKKVDPTGTWKWTVAGRQGGQDREFTLKLKQEGEKLTGKLTAPGRQGATTETDIKEAKLKGDEISFTTSVARGENTITSKYNGKISGDTIKGKIERPGRDGGTQETKWEAKREAEKK
jgi:hypothetical protein